MTTTDVLDQLSRDIAAAVPRVDANAEHERWQPGLGAFEEERQLDMLVAKLGETSAWAVDREVPYPNSDQRCDLVVDTGTRRLPLEAKLLRFRRDNADREPNAFGTVFDPFSNSLVADARKLAHGGFEHSGGLLGLYYEPEDEDTVGMDAQTLAEKVRLDIDFWFDADATTCAIERFAGLRHPVHQRGAVVTWTLGSDG